MTQVSVIVFQTYLFHNRNVKNVLQQELVTDFVSYSLQNTHPVSEKYILSIENSYRNN